MASLAAGDVVVMSDGKVHTVVKVEAGAITLVEGAHAPENLPTAGENLPNGSVNPERNNGQNVRLLVLNAE